MAKGMKTGGGSRAGVPNKTTQEARAAIAEFVNGNADRLQVWLDQVAHGVKDPDTGEYVVAPNPEKAFQLFSGVIEYHVPKLARTETSLTGPNGGPIQHQEVPIIVEGVKPT